MLLLGKAAKKTCNPDNELEFEFFMYQDRVTTGQTDPLKVWELTDVKTGGRLLENQATSTSRKLVYEKACVPRSSSCLKFYIGYPPNTEIFDTPMLSIRLDGVVYKERSPSFGFEDESLNSTTFLGSCAVEDICNATAEHLVEQTFTTKTDLNCSNSIFEYSSGIFSSDFFFYLKDVDATSSMFSDYISSGWLYEDFEAGRSYASKACIPKDKCAHLLVQTGSSLRPVKSYSIFQDGEELTERVALDNVGFFEDIESTETKAGACANANSSGSTLPLTLGRLMVATWAVVLTFW